MLSTTTPHCLCSQRGLFVRDPQLIAEAYLKSSFALDLVSSIPLSMLLGSDSSECSNAGTNSSAFGCGDDTSALSRANRLLRLLRLSKLLRIMKLGRFLKVSVT